MLSQPQNASKNISPRMAVKKEPVSVDSDNTGKHPASEVDLDRVKEEPVKKKLRPSRPLKSKSKSIAAAADQEKTQHSSSASADSLEAKKVKLRMGSVNSPEKFPEVNSSETVSKSSSNIVEEKQKIIDGLQEQFVLIQSENLYKSSELKELKERILKIEKEKELTSKEQSRRIENLEKENTKLKSSVVSEGNVKSSELHDLQDKVKILEKENEKLNSNISVHVKSAADLLKTITSVKTKVDQVTVAESKQVQNLQIAVKNLESEKKNLLKSVEVLKKKSNVKPSNHNDCDKKVKDLMIERLNLFQNLTDENQKVAALEKRLSDYETSLTNTADENISLKKNQKELDKALKTFKNKIEEFTRDKKRLEEAKSKISSLETENKQYKKNQAKVNSLKKKISDLQSKIKELEQGETSNADVPVASNPPGPEIIQNESEIVEPMTESMDTTESESDKGLGSNRIASNEKEESPVKEKIPFRNVPLVMTTNILHFSMAENNNADKNDEKDESNEMDEDPVSPNKTEVEDEDRESEGEEENTVPEEQEAKASEVDSEGEKSEDETTRGIEEPLATLSEEDEAVDVTEDKDVEALLKEDDDTQNGENKHLEDDLNVSEKHHSPRKVSLSYVSDDETETFKDLDSISSTDKQNVVDQAERECEKTDEQQLDGNEQEDGSDSKEDNDNRDKEVVACNEQTEENDEEENSDVNESLQIDSNPSHCNRCGVDLQTSSDCSEGECAKMKEYRRDFLEILCEYCDAKDDHWAAACNLLISFCEICHCWGHGEAEHVADEADTDPDTADTATYSGNKRLERLLRSYNTARAKHFAHTAARQLPENSSAEEGKFKYAGSLSDVRAILKSLDDK